MLRTIALREYDTPTEATVCEWCSICTTGLEVEQSVLEMSGELRSIVVDHLLKKCGVVCLGFTQIVQDL